MKKIFISILFVFSLFSCFKIEDKIYLNNDLSGKIEIDLRIVEGALENENEIVNELLKAENKLGIKLDYTVKKLSNEKIEELFSEEEGIEAEKILKEFENSEVEHYFIVMNFKNKEEFFNVLEAERISFQSELPRTYDEPVVNMEENNVMNINLGYNNFYSRTIVVKGDILDTDMKSTGENTITFEAGENVEFNYIVKESNVILKYIIYGILGVAIIAGATIGIVAIIKKKK